MNTSAMENVQSRQNFFQNAITRMANYWNNSEAVKAIQVSTLDKERETILKAITLAMDVSATWPVTKNLIVTFTPYMERRGHWEVWHDLLITAIDKAQSLDDFDGAITLTALLARLCLRQSRHKESVQLSRKVIQLAKKSGNKFEEARTCSNLGFYFMEKGHWWRSKILCCHALKIFEQLESTHGLAHTHNHLGLLYAKMQDIQQAEKHLQLAGGLGIKLGDDNFLSTIYGNLGMLYLHDSSRFDEVAYYITNAIEKAEHSGDTASIASNMMNLAKAYRNIGSFEQALTYLNKAEKIHLENGDSLGLAKTWHNFGELYLHQDNYSEGKIYLEKAINIFRKLNIGLRIAGSLDSLIVYALENNINPKRYTGEFNKIVNQHRLKNYPEIKETYTRLSGLNVSPDE